MAMAVQKCLKTSPMLVIGKPERGPTRLTRIGVLIALMAPAARIAIKQANRNRRIEDLRHSAWSRLQCLLLWVVLSLEADRRKSFADRATKYANHDSRDFW